jgi:hypothetical protein
MALLLLMKQVDWLQVNLLNLRLEGILVGYYQVPHSACLLLPEIVAYQIRALHQELDSLPRAIQSD